ncbi:hypothetical protein D3C79_945470 [compost metagenome]
MLEQLLPQLRHQLHIRPGKLVDLLAHTLEVVVINRILAYGRVITDGGQPGFPALAVLARHSQWLATG